MGEPNKQYTDYMKGLAAREGKILGIDISRRVDNVDLQGLWDEGYRVLLLKIGEYPLKNGPQPDNPETHLGSFMIRAREAKKIGFKVGGWWYIKPRWDAEVMANHIWSVFSLPEVQAVNDFPVILDVEEEDGLSDAEVIKWLQRFVVDYPGPLGIRRGECCMVYTSHGWMKHTLDGFEDAPELQYWPEWLARLTPKGDELVPPIGWNEDPNVWGWQVMWRGHSEHVTDEDGNLEGFGLSIWQPDIPPLQEKPWWERLKEVRMETWAGIAAGTLGVVAVWKWVVAR